MRLRRTKSEPERLLEKVTDSLGALPHAADRGTLLKAGLIAGGAAALAMGSAAVSSLRRRAEAS